MDDFQKTQDTQTSQISQTGQISQSPPVAPPIPEPFTLPVSSVLPTPPVSSTPTSPVVPPASSLSSPPLPKLKEREMGARVPETGPGAGEGAKDAAAEADKIAKEEGDEYWESYAREIELEKELEAIGGIEKVESGEVKVPQELAEQMGIRPAVTAQTPLEKVTGFAIRGVSLTDDQLSSGKTKPVQFSLRWLVEWFILELLKAHYIIRFIKGKILRLQITS